MANERDYDVVVFGATGFVGRLTAAYLARAAPVGTRLALAGRSQAKLEAVRATLPLSAADCPILVADSGDVDSLRRLAAKTRVVATTVGPYARHGLPLVEACATAGTHYADLTGEVRFVRDVIDRYDDAARQSGARIVVSCGFDSIPSDLGVMVLHDAVQRDGAGTLEQTRLVVTTLKGGVSGGTLASLAQQLDDMRSDRVVRHLVADPYSLSPDRDHEPRDLGVQRDRPVSIVHDRELMRWLTPFAMGSFNTRIVRRSNALQGWAYGRGFRYSEWMGFRDGPRGLTAAVGVTAGLGAVTGGLMTKPTRALLDRVLPSPGQGPSERTQRAGRFAIEIHAQTSLGARYVATVTGQGDPGYSGTAVMLGEAALALAGDGDTLPPGSGVLTPATGVGQPLVDRLRHQPFSFDVRPTVVTS